MYHKDPSTELRAALTLLPVIENAYREPRSDLCGGWFHLTGGALWRPHAHSPCTPLSSLRDDIASTIFPNMQQGAKVDVYIGEGRGCRMSQGGVRETGPVRVL